MVGDSIEAVCGHTASHHYHFKLVDERVEMTYKHWSDDEEWETSVCDTPLDLIKEAANLHSTTPIVSRDFTPLNMDKLGTDLSHLPSNYIPPEKMEKWNHLIKNLIETTKATTKPMPQLAPVTTLSRAPAVTPSGSKSSLLPPSIQKIVNKSNERPAVRALLQGLGQQILDIYLEMSALTQ